MPDDIGELGRTIAANLSLALELSQQAGGIAEQAKELVGTAASTNGAVRVEVDHRGFMTNLRFSDKALDSGIGSLGALVTETTAEAIADLQQKGEALRASLVIDPRTLIDTTDIERRLDELAESVLHPRSEGSSWPDTK